MQIRDNYYKVVENIQRTAIRCGRNPGDIQLVVVTKKQPIELIEEVIEAGAMNLGENYVEDALPKIISLNRFLGIKWHMIGHVQSRKAELVCSNFQYLHSLDSVKLAVKMNSILDGMDRYIPAWLEFNISGEQTKSGWNIGDSRNWNNIITDIEKIFALRRIKLLGVMAMPPYSENPENSRQFFRKLRKFHEMILERIQPEEFTALSIGMSGDYEVAIEEGSTCVRIGQAIFGPRNG